MASLLRLSLIILPLFAGARQPFLNNKQLDCDSSPTNSSVLGYTCSPSSDPPSCPSFLFSPSTVPPSLVPSPCSCTPSGLYQSNSSYTILSPGETYFSIANLTFHGLTTCQALIAQNPSHPSRLLFPGISLLVPLRCACPDASQRSAGVRFLLTYLISKGDTIDLIAARFRVSPQSILLANSLSPSDTIYPFNTLLVPLSALPSPSSLLPTPPAPPSPPPPPPSLKKSSHKNQIILGLTLGISIFLIFSLFCLAHFLFRRKRRGEKKEEDHSLEDKIRDAVIGSSLVKFDYPELEKGTGFFSEKNRIRMSRVYRGDVRGDVVAVRRMMPDAARHEIDVLTRINHANVVRLLGFCCRRDDAFLVYQLADLGSLAEALWGDYDKRLDWCKRAMIACDVVEALDYLHGGVRPAVVHMNVSSRSVLLGKEFRAKLGKFEAARPVDLGGGPAELTAHVAGTQGYLAPEYLEHGLVSTKLDVYAFGVVLIELVSGKSASNRKEKEQLTVAARRVVEGEDAREKLAQFVDPRLGSEFPIETVFAMAQLATRCVADDYNSRPSARELLVALNAIHSSSLDWDPMDNASAGSVSEQEK